jgi:probable HAF family extracellular repeat protein
MRPSVVVIATAALIFMQGPVGLTQPAPTADFYFIADLGTLGGAQSAAAGINELGQVVGSAARSDGTTHAFFFDGSMRDLGTIGGTDSAATDVNRPGQIVGHSLTALGNTKGFIYSAGVRRSFGTLGGRATRPRVRSCIATAP